MRRYYSTLIIVCQIRSAYLLLRTHSGTMCGNSFKYQASFVCGAGMLRFQAQTGSSRNSLYFRLSPEAHRTHSAFRHRPEVHRTRYTSGSVRRRSRYATLSGGFRFRRGLRMLLMRRRFRGRGPSLRASFQAVRPPGRRSSDSM